jgi:hypothetical protein
LRGYEIGNEGSRNHLRRSRYAHFAPLVELDGCQIANALIDNFVDESRLGLSFESDNKKGALWMRTSFVGS